MSTRAPIVRREAASVVLQMGVLEPAASDNAMLNWSTSFRRSGAAPFERHVHRTERAVQCTTRNHVGKNIRRARQHAGTVV